MDYEKAYKEAIKRAKSFRTPDNKDVAAYIFPELSESEDEKTRKELLLDIPKVFPHDKAFRYIAYLEKQGEKKPILDVEIPFGADSELVEETITIPDGCYAIIENNKVILRKGEKKSSWGEEDKAMLNLIIARLHSHPNVDLEEYSKEYDWLNYGLRFLRHQSTWKPSDEQMEALNNIKVTGCISYAGQGQELDNLYQDLNKLREE